MRKIIRKILAGWEGCLLDFQYWLELVGPPTIENCTANSQDFFEYLGEWLEERSSSPAPWASSVIFCSYASIQWVKGNGGFILKAAPRYKDVDFGDEL